MHQTTHVQNESFYQPTTYFVSILNVFEQLIYNFLGKSIGFRVYR